MKVPTFLRPIQVTMSFRAQALPGKWRSVVPWWYARGGPPQGRLGRFTTYYPFPAAWFLRVKRWLWERTGQAVILWLYDVAIVDYPETEDIVGVRGILRLMGSFTLRGGVVYIRQLRRARVGDWRDRGYREGYAAGCIDARKKLDDAVKATITGMFVGTPPGEAG